MSIELRRQGRSTKVIARELGGPRSTGRPWFGRRAGVAQTAEATDLKSVQWGFESLHQHQHQHPAYAYLRRARGARVDALGAAPEAERVAHVIGTGLAAR